VILASYLSSHSQCGSPIAMHFVSLTCWFLTAEKNQLRKPVVKWREGSSALTMKLPQFCRIFKFSSSETLPTL